MAFALALFPAEPLYNMFLLRGQSGVSSIVLVSGVLAEELAQGMNNPMHSV